jgi:hypothetical protein
MSKKPLVKQLTQKPRKETGTDMPHYQVRAPGVVQQSDLLFLPHDEGYKYALVVVDAGSRQVDAEPLKSKKSKDIISAFKTIYKRGIHKLPRTMTFDSGNEFKGDVAKWFTNQNVYIKVALPGRHRQVALVEAYNKILGKRLFERMIEEEIAVGQPSTQWVEDLPRVVETINATAKERVARALKNFRGEKKYSCKGSTCDIWPRGTLVRKALDAPRDTFGKKLAGKFRETDIRWSIEPHTITDYLFKPYQPPLYVLDNDNRALYTKQQLMKYKPGKVSESSIRPKIKDNKVVWTIEKIVNKRKNGRKLELQVKWAGFAKPTWEPYKIIKEDVPDLVQEFEEEND